MKFYNNEYFKHENCVDAFFAVFNVKRDDENVAEICGYWYVQGLHNHWCASDYECIRINDKNYSKWKKYDLITTKREV